MTGQIGPFWLDPREGHYEFPDPHYALTEPNGLLAVGGSLSAERLLRGYRLGVFPWYSDGQPILWWTPDPRAVLYPDRLRVSRSLRKTLRRKSFRVTMDEAFGEVIRACAESRKGQEGTWISDDMIAAYERLHRAGYAHSVESWSGDRLAGGLYGVALGGTFYGESMFARQTDASKVAFVHLVRQIQAWGFGIIDCQMTTGHLMRLGAEEIPRSRFMQHLNILCAQPGRPGRWQMELQDVEG